MKITRCDFCGKEFQFGTKITIGLSRTIHNDFNISPFRKYTGEYDLCIECAENFENVLERCKQNDEL